MAELDELHDIANGIMGNTICAFGEGTAMPALAFLQKFRKEFEAYVRGERKRAGREAHRGALELNDDHLGTHLLLRVRALGAGRRALGVVASKNPIRGAMGLLLLILSVAGLFLALHAQFLAAIQLIVYAGAIIILFLFVIMLLGPSASTPRDRRGIVGRAFGGGLFGLAGAGRSPWSVIARAGRAGRSRADGQPDAGFGGIDAFGSVLFSDALVPFELSSALLMVAVVGAVAVAKGRQGVTSLPKASARRRTRRRPPMSGAGPPTSSATSPRPRAVPANGRTRHP